MKYPLLYISIIVFFVGWACNKDTRVRKTTTTEKNKIIITLQHIDSLESIPDNYLFCIAILTEFEEEYPWFEDSEAGHDDGVAPYAAFQILTPEKHA